jgi:hypothetical protein
MTESATKGPFTALTGSPFFNVFEITGADDHSLILNFLKR